MYATHVAIIGTHFTNALYLAIQIPWLFLLHLKLKIQRLLENFAHDSTIVLSRHVQPSVVI